MEKENASQHTPKKKKIAHELVDVESAEGLAVHVMKNELIEKNHEDLRDARIAVAWNLSWSPDVDGRLQIGKCKLASDLDRELADFDLVVILLREFWTNEKTTDAHRSALLDHELSHAALQLDKNLEPIEDEKGRKCYRIRKHDIEEFSAVVAQHGLYKKELEQFAKAIQRGKQRGLFDEADAEDRNSGEPAMEDESDRFPRAVAAGAEAQAEAEAEQ